MFVIARRCSPEYSSEIYRCNAGDFPGMFFQCYKDITMYKKALVTFLLTAVSLTAHAEWIGGVSYTSLSDDDAGVDVDLGALSGSIGYTFRQNEFSIIPEVHIGLGISDDSVTVLGTKVDVELDRFIVLAVRGQYSFNESFYVYAQPSYANAKLTAKASGISVSDDDWEFGIGAGGGFQVNPKVAAELGYDTYDGTDAISVGLRFNF